MGDYFEPVDRPRVLADGLTDEELAALAPLVGKLTAREPGQRVHAEEFDAIIATDSQYHDHDFYKWKLLFAPEPAPPPSPSSTSGWAHIEGPQSSYALTQHHPAQSLELSDWAKEHKLEGLVRRSCVPAAEVPYVGVRTPLYPKRTVSPFLAEKLDRPLIMAGLFEVLDDNQSTTESAVWLPNQARSHLREWLAFAFSHWRQFDSSSFPADADWKLRDEWSVPEETESRQAVVAFDEAEAARRAAAETQRTELTRSVEEARQLGDQARVLLEGSGTPLVSMVGVTLEDLGFHVLDADHLPEHKGAKREDLRINDGDWTCLVEVKGYASAAKTSDLIQAASTVPSFVSTQGRLPDALWYVVNAYKNTDPHQRARALDSREEDVIAFGDAYNGCVIDTRDLFRLWQCVKGGQISPEQARSSLRSTKSRFTFPA